MRCEKRPACRHDPRASLSLLVTFEETTRCFGGVA